MYLSFSLYLSVGVVIFSHHSNVPKVTKKDHSLEVSFECICHCHCQLKVVHKIQIKISDFLKDIFRMLDCPALGPDPFLPPSCYPLFFLVPCSSSFLPYQGNPGVQSVGTDAYN